MLPVALIFDSSQAFTRGVLRGIEQFAQTRPRWSLLFHDAHSVSASSLRETRPKGVIAHVINQSVADLLLAQTCHVVNTSFMCRDAPFPRVTVDNFEVGRIAFEHLYERGFRNFGLVGHSHHVYSSEREAGFCATLDKSQSTYSGFYRRHDHVGSPPGAPLDGSADLRRWLRKLPKPVGILTCRGVWGVQVVEACRIEKLNVPEDVGVVCVDDDDLLCELSRPSLSSILVPSERIGVEAAALLDRLLHSRPSNARRRLGRTPAPHLVSPTRFIARQSSDVYAGTGPEMAAAMRFIRHHAHEGIHVDDVAREVGLPRRALELQFRQTLHRGIGEEIRRIRLVRAEHLLTSTELSVGEVAAQAGFTSVYYMSRFFSQQIGLTPTAYRRKHRRVAH